MLEGDEKMDTNLYSSLDTQICVVRTKNNKQVSYKVYLNPIIEQIPNTLSCDVHFEGSNYNKETESLFFCIYFNSLGNRDSILPSVDTALKQTINEYNNMFTNIKNYINLSEISSESEIKNMFNLLKDKLTAFFDKNQGQGCGQNPGLV